MFVSCECCMLHRSRPLRQADPSSREVLPSVYVSMCLWPGGINPLHLQWIGRTGTTKKITVVLCMKKKQDGRCTYNVTLLQWKHNNAFCVYCWATCHCQMYKNIECCTTMLLWQIHVAGNNTTYVGRHVKCPMLLWNKRMFVCSRPSLDVQLG